MNMLETKVNSQRIVASSEISGLRAKCYLVQSVGVLVDILATFVVFRSPTVDDKPCRRHLHTTCIIWVMAQVNSQPTVSILPKTLLLANPLARSPLQSSYQNVGRWYKQ